MFTVVPAGMVWPCKYCSALCFAPGSASQELHTMVISAASAVPVMVVPGISLSLISITQRAGFLIRVTISRPSLYRPADRVAVCAVCIICLPRPLRIAPAEARENIQAAQNASKRNSRPPLVAVVLLRVILCRCSVSLWRCASSC